MKKFMMLLLVAVLVVAEDMSGCTPVTPVIKETVVVVTPTPPPIDKHEPNGTPDEATPFSLGESITSYISFKDDVDYYTFDTDELGTIEIELIDPSGPNYDYDISLLNLKFEEVAFSSTEADHEVISYRVGEGNTFYILVKPFTGYSESEPYSLRMTFEPLVGVTSLTLGEPKEEYLDEGEEKYYAINDLSGYKRLEVQLQGPEDADFELFVKRDSPPTTGIFDESSEQRGSEEAICIDDPSDTYYITVVSSTGSGSFSLTATAHETMPGATFHKITMAESVDDDDKPINPKTDFPAGTTKKVYAVWEYEGMYDGAIWRRMWLRDGEVAFAKTQTWEWGESGTKSWSFSREDGLLSGNYEFRLFICNELVQTADFTVVEEIK